MSKPKDVMNLPQLATYLQMSQASVYHLVAEGKIPGAKVGKQWRFTKAYIDKWLEGKSKPTSDVLVVDDEPHIQHLLVTALKDAGHRAVGVGSVDRALTLLDEFEFDLLLIDMILPDGNGIDVINAANSLPRRPEIVVITGLPDHELVAELQTRLPYVTILCKPVRLKNLMALAARYTHSTKEPLGV